MGGMNQTAQGECVLEARIALSSHASGSPEISARRFSAIELRRGSSRPLEGDDGRTSRWWRQHDESRLRERQQAEVPGLPGGGTATTISRRRTRWSACVADMSTVQMGAMCSNGNPLSVRVAGPESTSDGYSTVFLGQEMWCNHRLRVILVELFDALKRLNLLVMHESQYAESVGTSQDASSVHLISS